MTKRIPQPRSELSPRVRTYEAKLLAVMLRTSRLTWVFGEPGTDKGDLLKSGVMPLLQRRSSDRAAAPPVATSGLSAPERRRRTVGRPAMPRFEAAVYFDAWEQAPLSLLKRRIADIVPAAARADVVEAPTLAAMLQRLHQRLGLHFIILLDRFEEYLSMAPDEGEVVQFSNEMVAAILQQDLPASFLVSMDEVARPRLERFRARMPGFDHNVLRLSPVSELRDATPQPGQPMGGTGGPPQTTDPADLPTPLQAAKSANASARRGPPPRVPIRVEDVYAFIESTLTRTSTQAQAEPSQVDADASDPVAVPPHPASPATGPLKRRR